MSWKQIGSLEEAVLAMQPEKNFIYHQIEFDEQQKQYFHPPQPLFSDYITSNNGDTSSRLVAMQQKLALMNKIQMISHTKPYGEHSALSDWNNSDNIEEETIGMMRHFGMFSLADANLDKDNTSPVTVQTNGVYFSRNGNTSTPIILEEAYFTPRRHRHLREGKNNRLPPEFCNAPSSDRRDLDTVFCNPPAPSWVDEQYPSTKRVTEKKDYKPSPPSRGVVDIQLHNRPPNRVKPIHNFCEYEQDFNQPSDVIQENLESPPISSNMAKEQYKHLSDVVNKRRHSLVLNSESISEPCRSDIKQFNIILHRNRTMGQPSRLHRESLHPESSSAIEKVSKIKKCFTNMEIDPEAILAFVDNPKEGKRKMIMTAWSRAAEMRSTASSGSTNSDYVTANSSSSSSFCSAHSSAWSIEETENVEEIKEDSFGKFNKELKKQLTEEISKSQQSKKSNRNKSLNQKARLFGSHEFLDL